MRREGRSILSIRHLSPIRIPSADSAGSVHLVAASLEFIQSSTFHCEDAMSSNTSAAIREEIRRELESVRAGFLSLLEEIPEELWDRTVGPPRWTHRQLMSHIESYLSFVLPKVVQSARRGKRRAFPIPPKAIGDFFNYHGGRMIARRLTRRSLLEKYERSHAATIALLDGIGSDEWEKRTIYPAGDLTIAEQFKAHRVHFDHHSAQIRARIGQIKQTV
jgi:hypothetical protein